MKKIISKKKVIQVLYLLSSKILSFVEWYKINKYPGGGTAFCYVGTLNFGYYFYLEKNVTRHF